MPRGGVSFLIAAGRPRRLLDWEDTRCEIRDKPSNGSAMGQKPEPMEWRPGSKDPSPDEIREICERIRSSWTEAERHRRTVEQIEPISVEVIRVADIVV